MIMELQKSIPVYSYIVLREDSAKEFWRAVDFAALEDNFHYFTVDEVNFLELDLDVSIIIADVCRELHFVKPAKEYVSLMSRHFSHHGKKRELRHLTTFLRDLLSAIYFQINQSLIDKT